MFLQKAMSRCLNKWVNSKFCNLTGCLVILQSPTDNHYAFSTYSPAWTRVKYLILLSIGEDVVEFYLLCFAVDNAT